jgi:uncharacterized protein
VKTVVLYHANCWDGFCAAWLFHRVFSTAEFIPVNYGTEPPDLLRGRDVFIVDFSYPRQTMRKILSQANSVTVLDHHRTAQAELAGLVDEFTMRPDLIQNPPGSQLPLIVFDMNKSGGRLAWEYLTKYGTPGAWPTHAPWLVDYTEDRDLWRWKMPYSQAINAALRSYPLDFSLWDQWVGNEWSAWGSPSESFKTEGEAILRRERQIIADHVQNAWPREMDGHRILCVNATTLFSEIAGELAKDRPFGACYFDRADGKRQWSLRSRDGGVDVSEIAKAHGGGGHRNAAGFEE